MVDASLFPSCRLFLAASLHAVILSEGWSPGPWCLVVIAFAAARQAKTLADGPSGRGLVLSTGLLTSSVLGPSRSNALVLEPSRSYALVVLGPSRSCTLGEVVVEGVNARPRVDVGGGVRSRMLTVRLGG